MSNKVPVVRRVTLARKVVVPPNSVVRAKVSLQSLPGCTFMIDAPAYNHKGLLIPFSVTTTPDGVSDTSKHTSVVLNFLNDSEKYIHLRKGYIIRNAEGVEILSEVEPAIWSKLDSSDTSVVCHPCHRKDGKVRWCIDYRSLNNVTTKDAFPLPNISECLDISWNTMFFSTLVMSSGYYQISIDEEDRAKTAFLTKYGLYEHCCMPFGLYNAPATFQRAIMLILKSLTWKEVLAYLNDIMILGYSFDDHLDNIVQVREKFRKYILKLKAKKCSLFQRVVLFLGKIVNRNGISVNPDSVRATHEWLIKNFC